MLQGISITVHEDFNIIIKAQYSKNKLRVYRFAMLSSNYKCQATTGFTITVEHGKFVITVAAATLSFATTTGILTLQGTAKQCNISITLQTRQALHLCGAIIANALQVTTAGSITVLSNIDVAQSFVLQVKGRCIIGAINKFIKITAHHQRVEIGAKNIYLLCGRLYGKKNIMLHSAVKITLGKSEITPSYLASYGNIKLTASRNILVDHSDILTLGSGNLEIVTQAKFIAIAAKLNIAENVNISAKTVLLGMLVQHNPDYGHMCKGYDNMNVKLRFGAVYKTTHRDCYETVITTKDGLLAKSRATEMIVAGRVYFLGNNFNIFGSKLHVSNYSGVTPKLVNYREYQNYHVSLYAGHRKRKHAKEQNHYPQAYGKNYQAILSQSTPHLSETRDLQIAGIFVAPSIVVTGFNQGLIGNNDNLQLQVATGTQFKQVQEFKKLAVHSMLRISKNGPSVLQLDIPTVKSELVTKLAPAVMVTSEGFKLRSEDKRFLLSRTLETQQVHSDFLRNTCQGFYEKFNTPKKLYHAMRAAAYKTMLAHKKLKVLSVTEPILFYKDITYVHENGTVETVATPMSVCPKSLDHNQRKKICGMYSTQGDILLESNVNAELIINSAVYSKNKLSIKAGKLSLQKQRCQVQYTVVTVTDKKNLLLGKKRSCHKQEITTVLHQKDSGMLSGNKISIVVKDFHSIGGEINATTNGIKIIAKDSVILKPAINTNIKNYYSGAASLLKSVNTTGSLMQHSIMPTQLKSQKNIKIYSDNKIILESTQIASLQNIKIIGKKSLQLATTVFAEQVAPLYTSKKLSLTSISGVQQRVYTNQIVARGQLLLQTKRRLHATAPILVANKIITLAGSILLDAQKLQYIMTADMRGMHAVSYMHCKISYASTAGITGCISANVLKMQATQGSVTLVAPALFINNILQLRATEDINIKSLTFQHQKLIRQYSIGISYFCSDIIENYVLQDFTAVASALLHRFPIIGSCNKLSTARNKADGTIDAVEILYNAREFFNRFTAANSKNFKYLFADFLKQQDLKHTGIGYNKSVTKHAWTTTALPWLQARQLLHLVTPRDVNLSSINGVATNLKIIAGRNINFQPSYINNKISHKGLKINIKNNCNKNLITTNISISIDVATAESQAKQFAHGYFRVLREIYFKADSIDVVNIYLDTKKAIIVSRKMQLRTLQNKNSAKYSISGMNVGYGVYGVNIANSKNNVLWSDKQAGINAHSELRIKLDEELVVTGALLNLGNNGLGKITAAVIKYRHLSDKNIGKSYSVSIGADSMPNSKINSNDKRQINRATIAGNIAIECSKIVNIGSVIEDINHDIKVSQELVKNHNSSIGIVLPVIMPNFNNKNSQGVVMKKNHKKIKKSMKIKKSIKTNSKAKTKVKRKVKKIDKPKLLLSSDGILQFFDASKIREQNNIKPKISKMTDNISARFAIKQRINATFAAADLRGSAQFPKRYLPLLACVKPKLNINITSKKSQNKKLLE